MPNRAIKVLVIATERQTIRRISVVDVSKEKQNHLMRKVEDICMHYKSVLLRMC